MEKTLQREIHDMSHKIYELQEKTEHLTNGQRYAAINEIEKSIQPLRNDLRHLEHKLYTQQSNDENIQKDINIIIHQINELENIKSDLTTRINTEAEHTRDQLNNKIIQFMSEELSPIKKSIAENKGQIEEIKEDIQNLRVDIMQHNQEQELKQAKKFDNIKMLLTAVVAILAAISTLSLWLEPSIRTLMHIFM